MLTQWLTGCSGGLMYTHIDTSALSYVLRFHQCWVLVWMQKRCSISKDTSKLQVWHCSELHIFHKQDQKLFCYTEGWHWLFFIAELRQNEKRCLKMCCRIHLAKDKCGFKQKRKDFGGLCAHRSKVANFHSQFNFEGNSHSGLLWDLFEICLCSVWVTFWNLWRALAVETHFGH